jgi:hypothetical protein
MDARMSERGGYGAVILIALGVAACGGGGDGQPASKPPPTGPFAVSDYYVPRALQTQDDASKNVQISNDCIPRLANARGRCHRFIAASPGSYGFLFEYPGYDFGAKPGLALPATVTKLHGVCASSSDSAPGASLQVGWAPNSPETPYGDQGASSGIGLVCRPEWQPFEIPLLRIGGMVGIALGSEGEGPNTFYLDDLWFE